MPKIDTPLRGEIFLISIYILTTGKESPVVVDKDNPRKMSWNSCNAGVIWSSQFEVHHPKKALKCI